MTEKEIEERFCVRCHQENPEHPDGGLPSDWEIVGAGVVCAGCLTESELQAIDEAEMEIAALLSRCARCKRMCDVDDPEEHGWQLVNEGIICPDCRTSTDIQAQIRSDKEAAARLTEQPERGES
jgi:hypothetical protein